MCKGSIPLPGHNQSLREVRARTQGGNLKRSESEAIEACWLLVCLLILLSYITQDHRNHHSNKIKINKWMNACMHHSFSPSQVWWGHLINWGFLFPRLGQVDIRVAVTIPLTEEVEGGLWTLHCGTVAMPWRAHSTGRGVLFPLDGMEKVHKDSVSH